MPPAPAARPYEEGADRGEAHRHRQGHGRRLSRPEPCGEGRPVRPREPRPPPWPLRSPPGFRNRMLRSSGKTKTGHGHEG
ncbi:hypothetical protein GCM10017688_22830 [Streptomyces ramulosus]